MNTSPTTAIINAVILRPGYPAVPGGVLISGGKINRIIPKDELSPAPARAVIDAGGDYLVPGFIDLHVHGGGGSDFSEDGGRKLLRIIKFLAGFGTTAVLPTVAASSRENLKKIVQFISPIYTGNKMGGRVLGVNLEGPYLSIGKRGAQPLRFIRNPDLYEVEKLLDMAGGAVKIMTLAPELKGAFDLIRILNRYGVIAAAGHTTADYETMKKAIKAGISYATHIFNSYPPLHHRHPGAIGAILESDQVDTEFLSDGIHLSPVLIRLLFRMKPIDRLLLVTDAIEVMGRRIKSFTMGGRTITVDSAGARMADGTLVGSMLPMNQALRNVIKFTGIPLSDALVLVTANPARLLEIEDRKGDIRAGMDADLVIMDRKCNIKRTIIAGETVYRRQ
jgi:N-acetylglucosamine-6-phosphate deacetylase